MTRSQVDFVAEALLTSLLMHPHIVTLHGIVEEGGSPMIVCEFMDGGDLLSFLRQRRGSCSDNWSGMDVDAAGARPVPNDKVWDMCRQLCMAMTYLERRGMVHRDLAARNILISDDSTLKLADFGLSRRFDDEKEYYRKSADDGRMPWRWWAPEAIESQEFRSSNDVWSFAVVLWEITTLGALPYAELGGAKVVDTLQMVVDGYRLPRGPHCDAAVYALMQQCWHGDPDERPTFSAIMGTLRRRIAS